MSDGMVRKWDRKFNEGHDNLHDELWSSQPSVVSDNLVRTVKAKVHEDWRFTILSPSLHFQQNCDRLFVLSEIVPTLGAEDALLRNTKRSKLPVHWPHDTVSKVMGSRAKSSQVTRCAPHSGIESSSPWSGGTPHSQKKSIHSSTPFQAARADAVFGDSQKVLLAEFLPQGTTINSTAFVRPWRNFVTRSRTKGDAHLLADSCCFMTMLGCTPLLKLKPSSRHLAGNNSITRPTAQTWCQVTFICLCTWRSSLLASISSTMTTSKKQWRSGRLQRQPRSMRRGYRNWCPNNGGNYAEK